jgi:hypothetical protein
MLRFSGLREGTPFTKGVTEPKGTVTMFMVRTGVTAEYAITPNVVGFATPLAFSYSPPGDGINPDISSLTRFDFLLGVGYRM